MHTRDAVAAMARQYVRTVVASVQRVAILLAPNNRLNSQLAVRQSPGTPEALLLVRRIVQSYR